MPNAVQRLRRLARLRDRFGKEVSAEKTALFRALERSSLPRAADVLALHELLCFCRAYPDGPQMLRAVERALRSFRHRGDLKRHRRALQNSGIAGTETRFRFFAPTASWLATRWGDRLRIDWGAFEETDALERLLPLLSLYTETPGLDEIDLGLRAWIRLLKGRRETDATFLIRRFDALRVDGFVRESMLDGLDVPFVLLPGPTTPSRTLDRNPRSPVVFRRGGKDRGRPTQPDAAHDRPVSIRRVAPSRATELIDLARRAMVPRQRDLDVFSHASREDVRLVAFDGGLEFACFGVIPERRLLLEAVYGFLTLQNGAPVGYVLASALYGSAEIAYNVFDTFRGGEAGRTYGRVLAMVRSLFGVDSFTIFPFQLGQGNPEGIRSGAWWFYRKVGFRPIDARVIALARREERRVAADPGHRSSASTLEKLASANLYYSLGAERDDVIGRIELANVGLAVSRHLAKNFGSNREEAERTCSKDAQRLLRVFSLAGFSRGERLAWERWSPLVMVLPGVAGWSPRSKRDLVSVIRAKGGRAESEFARRFDRHRPLRRAILELSRKSQTG